MNASVGANGDASVTRSDNAETTATKSEETEKLGASIRNRKRKRLRLIKGCSKKKKQKMSVSLEILQYHFCTMNVTISPRPALGQYHWQKCHWPSLQWSALFIGSTL